MFDTTLVWMIKPLKICSANILIPPRHFFIFIAISLYSRSFFDLFRQIHSLLFTVYARHFLLTFCSFVFLFNNSYSWISEVVFLLLRDRRFSSFWQPFLLKQWSTQSIQSIVSFLQKFLKFRKFNKYILENRQHQIKVSLMDLSHKTNQLSWTRLRLTLIQMAVSYR